MVGRMPRLQQLLLLMLPSLLLRFSLQVSLAGAEKSSSSGSSPSDPLLISSITREIAITDDTDFMIQCSAAQEIQHIVKQLYWKWGSEPVAQLKNETRLIDMGDGRLLIKKVVSEYKLTACVAVLSNGTQLSKDYMYMAYNPLNFVRNFVTHEDFTGSYTEHRKLEPGFETTLYCFAQCACQYDRSWFYRLDGGPEIRVSGNRDLDQLIVSLLSDANSSLYQLNFRPFYAGLSHDQSKLVPVTGRVQVLCRLTAFTDPDSIKRYPVLKYTASNITSTFPLMFPAPATTPPVPSTQHCSRLSSLAQPLLPVGHVCAAHVGHLSPDTAVDAERLGNVTSVLASGTADRDNPHLAHCATLAQAMLCLSALCTHRPCREHCLLVRDHVCPAEVKLLRDFPACERFPEAEAEPACLKQLDLESVLLRSRPAPGSLEFKAAAEESECFSRVDFWRGMFYRGGARPLADGESSSPSQPTPPPNCADWSEGKSRLVSETYFASLRGAGRACRNPGAMFHRPSCVDRSNTRFFVTCAVLDCDPNPPLRSAGHMESSIAIGACVGGIALLVIVGSVVLLMRLRLRASGREDARKSGGLKEECVSLAQSHTALAAADSSNVQRNVKYGKKTHLAKTYPKLERLAYSHDDFMGPGLEIGKGAFFRVYRVETTKYKDERPDMPRIVALKVLEETADDQIVESFFSEAELLLGIEHRYVMQVFGICASTRPFCLLVEYCEFGDLQSLLRRSGDGKPPVSLHELQQQQQQLLHVTAMSNGVSSRDSPPLGLEPTTVSFQSPQSAPSEARSHPQLELKDLMRMGYQVANAMSYISNRGLVFRDLASRNILVTSGYSVRLADFGMCRKLPLGANTACAVQESEHLPVRWLAPETVTESRFYKESDVYAYGVLLWELFTLGRQPWAGMTVEQVWEMKHREPDSLLSRPERAPDEAWKLMMECWATDRAARPKFGALTSQLHQATSALEQAAATADA